MNSDPFNTNYIGQKSTREVLVEKLEGYFRSIKQSIDVRNYKHSTSTCIITFLNHEGGNRMSSYDTTYSKLDITPKEKYQDQWILIGSTLTNKSKTNNNKIKVKNPKERTPEKQCRKESAIFFFKVLTFDWLMITTVKI